MEISTDAVGAFIKAVAFAAEKHRDQRRKDADASPCINHPIALADVLANEYAWHGGPPIRTQGLFAPKPALSIIEFSSWFPDSVPSVMHLASLIASSHAHLDSSSQGVSASPLQKR